MSATYDDLQTDSDSGIESIIVCSTSAGDFSLKLHRDWSPNGYDRAVELFERGYYDNSHFFRVVPGFLVQFGIGYTTDQELKHFASQRIPDDPHPEPRIDFDEGVVAFAGSGPNSRTSHLFIAYAPRESLGTQLWETPIGTIMDGIETIRSLNHEYGDMPPWGHGPGQHKIEQGGEAYIETQFPHLDKFIHCEVETETDEIEAENETDMVQEKQSDPVAENEVMQGEETSSIHVAVPIVAAVVFFFLLMYVTKKGRKKMTTKTKNIFSVYSMADAIDLEQLKSRAEKCVEVIGTCNDGPGANRFCAEIKRLLSGIELSQDNCLSKQHEIKDIDHRLNVRKEETEQASIDVQESDIKITNLRSEIGEIKNASNQTEESTYIMKSKIKEMAEENEYLQTFIRRGPGWTDAQKHDRDCIIQKLESERNTHDQTQNDLFNIRQRIDHTESKILDVDKLRDRAAVDLQRVEKRIEESNNKYLAKQTQMNEAENRIETLTLQLQEYQEQLRYNDENIKEEMLDSKKITQSTKDVQLDIEKCCREFKEYGRKMVPISKELERQHQKNIELETENREQIKLIDEKTNEAMLFAKETVISEKKKELISEKIVDAEKRRIECEGERDDLKLKLNKLGSVELKMIAEEMETQKRQLEGLKREMGLLERKKTLTEHSSSLVQDIIASNSSTLKNLQNESEACSVIAKRHTRDIEELQKSLNKEREGTNIATRKRREALNCLVEQELQIEDIHKKLESAETTRKQKQSQCDSIKAECNLQAKRLAENHDGLELAKRKIGLIRRETKTLKVQILSTENNTVMEHYNHHHAGEEKEVLKNELDKLRLQMADTDQLLERNNNELLELGNLIANKDRECDKYSKEYSVLASNRDILGSLLVQKSAELEKLHEQIQGQQSILHHGELQYSELVSSIQGHVMKLKDLLIKKEQNVELEKVNNELTIEAHALENNIHSDKLRTVALRDELGRPANIHRWRSLEHRDPQKFEKIKRIQRLQKQMIATTEIITEKDVLIREQEREYLELQRISSHQPQLSEVQEQLEIYQSNLSEKLGQMEQIEFELEVQKRRVSDLNEDIQSLESEGKYLQEEWIQERKANESFTSK